MGHTMHQESSWRVYADGTAEPAGQGGIDFGNGTKPITVWAEEDSTIMLKVPGGKHWSSQLHPSVSHPGHYRVYHVTSVTRELVDRSGRSYKLLGVEFLMKAPLSRRSVE